MKHLFFIFIFLLSSVQLNAMELTDDHFDHLIAILNTTPLFEESDTLFSLPPPAAPGLALMVSNVQPQIATTSYLKKLLQQIKNEEEEHLVIRPVSQKRAVKKEEENNKYISSEQEADEVQTSGVKRPKTLKDILLDNVVPYDVSKNTYECKECSRICNGKKGLYNHYIQNHRSEPSICDECGRSYDRPDSLGKHKLRKHSPLKLECLLCDKKFATRGDFNSHMKGKKHLQESQS